VWTPGSADTVCPRPPLTLTFHRLTLKLVCESHLRWGTFLPNLGTLGFGVLQLFAMYATDGQTDGQKQRLLPPSLRSGHNNGQPRNVERRAPPSLLLLSAVDCFASRPSRWTFTVSTKYQRQWAQICGGHWGHVTAASLEWLPNYQRCPELNIAPSFTWILEIFWERSKSRGSLRAEGGRVDTHSAVRTHSPLPHLHCVFSGFATGQCASSVSITAYNLQFVFERVVDITEDRMPR